MGKFNEILNSIKTIKINSKENYFKNLYLNIFQSHVSATLKSQMLSQVINAFYRTSGITVILIVFIYLFKRALISELTAIFYSLISIVSILNSVIGIQVNINNFLPSYEQLNTILNDAEINKEKFGKTKFEYLKKEVQIKKLYFHYDKDEPVLKNINLEIKNRLLHL